MMEPVEIDIILKQNVDQEADKATTALDNVTKSSDDTSKAIDKITDAADEASKAIDKVTESTEEANRAVDKITDSSEGAAAAIDKITETSKKASEETFDVLEFQKQVIERLKTELNALEQQFEKVNKSTHDPKVIAERKRLKDAVIELRAELEGEESALIELEKATTKVSEKQETLLTKMRNVKNEMAQLKLDGQQETDMYKEKEDQLKTLAIAHKELTDEQKTLVKGGAQMQGFLSGLSALSGLLSAGGGALGLFNANSEDYAKIQTRVQSLMAITIGLQQVQNTLHQTSAFRVHTVAKANQMWAAANLRVATTLGISTIAAKALMATLTLGLSVAIGAVIAISSKFIEKQKAIREEQQKLADTIANTSASQIASYEAVRMSYNKLGDDVKAKEKFILDNQDAFKGLGVSIDTVNDADNVFIRNTVAFKGAIMERAKATAAMDIASEKYKEALKKQGEADNIKVSRWRSTKVVEDKDGNLKTVDRKAEKLRGEAEKLEKEAEAMVGKAVSSTNKANEILADAGIKQVDNKVKETKKGIDKQEKEFEKAGERLIKLSADIEKETNAAVIAAMQEGLSKRLAQIDNEYNERKNLIAQRLAEIEELEATQGIDASKQKQELQALADAEKQRYEQMTASANAGATAALDSVWDEINSRFNTESQNRLAQINSFYAEQIAKAQENGATQFEIDQMSASHKKDIELEKQHIALETLDFETNIELKRAQIQDKNVILASAREEKILKISIEAAEKRLAKLKELEANGGDVAKEIKATTVEIESMNAALAQTPANKLQEMVGYMQDVLGGLGDFASIFDEDLGGLFDMASGAVSGVAGVATGIMSGNPQAIIDGAMKLLETVGKVIQANKQANEEIRKFNLGLAQQAIDYSLAVIRAIKDVKSETDNIFTENYTNTLTQGMSSYSSAIDKQAELMGKLGQATVKTGVEKKKFLGITYGTRDVYSSLLKSYPDLINKDGELNRKLAETLKASGNLNKETQDLIDNILKASDAANEAMQAVESELQNLVGSIGTELKKALDDAFASGTDSARAMTDSVVNMLKDLSTQKLFNAVFGKMFSELEDKMKDSYGAGGDKDLSDDIRWFMSEYAQGLDDYNKGLEQFRELMKEQYGSDPFGEDGGRSAAAKGIAQASQDSIDELNGRITFLVMKVADIVSVNSENNNYAREQLLVNRAMLGELEVIAENSYFLRNLTNIREGVDRLVREGTFIKK